MAEKQKKSPAGAWLDITANRIRFKPDRTAVREELSAHLEDKALDLQRIFPDLTEEEAQQRAAAEMGDPEVVGRELAKIHKPWLGYAWIASQLLLAAVVIGLAVLLSDLPSYVLWPGGERVPSQLSAQAGGLNRRPLACWGEQTAGAYTFRLREAELWTAPDGQAQAVYLVLEAESPRPWEGLSSSFAERLWAEDSFGTPIPSQQEVGTGQAVSGGQTGWNGPFREQFSFLIPLPHPAAEGITLRYDYLGAQFSMPVMWKGAVP